MSQPMQREFGKIYREATWGDRRSGPGSAPEHVREYCDLLQGLVKERGIRRVVDLGCGDWSFSRSIDWTGVDYTGIDVVPELVDHLNETFGTDNIRFQCGSLLTCDLPEADLAISKDVLQHWPNADVSAFLPRIEGFPLALVTNDHSRVRLPSWKTLWRRSERGSPNQDIRIGGSRALRLTEPPFDWRARRLALLDMEIRGIVFTKEALLWERDPE